MFFSVLGGEWFTDSPVDMENKDGMLLLGKTWIVKLAELGSMARARNHTAVKAFISRQVDAYRPPYGRVTVEVPRTSVFVGTTNEDEFLTDATGNRRYWPIRADATRASTSTCSGSGVISSGPRPSSSTAMASSGTSPRPRSSN